MRIIVVSPHPDDETLGAGGTLLRYKAEGNEIFWLNITSITLELGYTKDQIDKKNKQMEEVKKKYHIDGFMNLCFPTTKLEIVDTTEAISQIGKFFDEVEPELVILPNPYDAHSDHAEVFKWGYACTKKFRHPYVKKVMTMEVPSETDFGSPYNAFNPILYVDISSFLKEKLEIMSIYEGEMAEHPFPRSSRRIEALATLRGGECGAEYAESFCVLKEYI